MSAETNCFCIVINTTKDEESGLFSRIRHFLSRQVTKLLYRLRSKASRILINGRPLADPPENPPIALRNLNFRKLRKIRQQLEVLEAANTTRMAAPTPDEDLATPMTGDGNSMSDFVIHHNERLSSGKVSTQEEDTFNEEQLRPSLKRKRSRPKDAKGKRQQGYGSLAADIDAALNDPPGVVGAQSCDAMTTCYNEQTLLSNPPADDNIIRYKPPRSKPAKGKRRQRSVSPEVDIDDGLENADAFEVPAVSEDCRASVFVLSDNFTLAEHDLSENTTSDGGRKKARPKAAKGPRRLELSQAVELSTDELIHTLGGLGYDTSREPKTRRPKAAKGPRKAPVTLPSTKEPLPDRIPDYLLDDQTGSEDVHKKATRAAACNSPVDDEDLFNILPYLPESQQKYAGNALKTILPWDKDWVPHSRRKR